MFSGTTSVLLHCKTSSEFLNHFWDIPQPPRRKVVELNFKWGKFEADKINGRKEYRTVIESEWISMGGLENVARIWPVVSAKDINETGLKRRYTKKKKRLTKNCTTVLTIWGLTTVRKKNTRSQYWKYTQGKELSLTNYQNRLKRGQYLNCGDHKGEILKVTCWKGQQIGSHFYWNDFRSLEQSDGI